MACLLLSVAKTFGERPSLTTKKKKSSVKKYLFPSLLGVHSVLRPILFPSTCLQLFRKFWRQEKQARRTSHDHEPTATVTFVLVEETDSYRNFHVVLLLSLCAMVAY